MGAVRGRFAVYHHAPSGRQLVGLRQIVVAIQRMADAQPLILSRLFDICFLPPGIGKTVTMTEAVRELLRRPEYRHVGVIVFLSQLEEIANLVAAMGLDVDDYAIVVSPESQKQFATLGNPNPDEARVLFTTQAQLQNRSINYHVLFNKLADFLYQGTARQVRLWDESIIPSAVYTLEEDEIIRMLPTVRANNAALYEILDAFRDELKTKQSGDTIYVPLIQGHGVGETKMTSWFPEKMAGAVRALWSLKNACVPSAVTSPWLCWTTRTRYRPTSRPCWSWMPAADIAARIRTGNATPGGCASSPVRRRTTWALRGTTGMSLPKTPSD